MDASLIHKILKEVEDYGLHQLSLIVQEFVEYVRNNLEAQFLHVKREANMVAHKMPKFGMEMQEETKTHILVPG